jgi:hypothetical protein
VTKLGYFIIDSFTGLIPALSHARVVKTGSPSLLKQIHDVYGDTKVYIARDFGQADDFARWESGRILTDPVGAAKYWVDAFRPAMTLTPWAKWESFNEMSNWDWMLQYGKFEAERQRIMHEEGFSACIGNFSTGSPPIKPDTNDPWEHFYPALEACDLYSNYLGLHEYGGLYMDMFYGPNQREQMLANQRIEMPPTYEEGWLFGRYRKVWRTHILPNGWTRIKIVLTELGLDRAGTDVIDKLVGYPVGPWTQCQAYWAAHDHQLDGALYYEKMLEWADRQLYRDYYVVGATIFCFGALSPVWQQWDVRGRVFECLNVYMETHRPPNEKIVSTGTRVLNVRTHPDFQSPVLTTLQNGTVVEVENMLDNWSYIRTGNITGWVFNDWLT